MAGSPVLSFVVAASVALGLREALDGPKDSPAVVRELEDWFGLESDQPVTVYPDWDEPDETWAVVRPWLMCRDRMWSD